MSILKIGKATGAGQTPADSYFYLNTKRISGISIPAAGNNIAIYLQTSLQLFGTEALIGVTLICNSSAGQTRVYKALRDAIAANPGGKVVQVDTGADLQSYSVA